jgi:hypothetical protein
MQMEDDSPLPQLMPQILQATADTAAWAMNNLRRRDHALKVPYSTSKLSGFETVEEHLTHDNVAKMIDMYGMGHYAFSQLVDELGLQASKYVAKEEKLAMFLRTVRRSAFLRGIQDGNQRARITESEYLKKVLALLVEKRGFYGKYVKMPNARSACPPPLAKPDREEFRVCIEAIDGTHLPIR